MLHPSLDGGSPGSLTLSFVLRALIVAVPVRAMWVTDWSCDSCTKVAAEEALWLHICCSSCVVAAYAYTGVCGCFGPQFDRTCRVDTMVCIQYALSVEHQVCTNCGEPV